MVLDDGRRIVDVAEAIGVGEGTLGNWVRLEKIERDERASEDAAKIKALAQENRELKRAKAILKSASALYAAELGRPQK